MLTIKQCLTVFLVLCLSSFVFAQNYVPNPSFERIKNLPCQPNQSAEEFTNLVYDWIQPTFGTPDIFTYLIDVKCPRHPFSQTELLNRSGWQAPRSNLNMAGIITRASSSLGHEYKEYIQAKLLKSLVPGKLYYAEMYVSRAAIPSYAANNMGIAFTPTSITDYTTFGTLRQTPNWGAPITPQILSKDIITDTVNWVKISDTFSVATVSDYITIGNFFPNNETQFISYPVTPSNASWYTAYYYLDDIYVDEYCKSRTFFDTLSCNKQIVSLEPSLAKGTFRWSNGATSTNINVGAPGVYWVDITLGDCTKRDSFYVASVTMPHGNFGRDTSFCKGTTLQLDATYPNSTYLWHDGSTQSTISVSKPGKYWVTITTGGCSKTDSVTVTEFSSPNINLGQDQNICQGSSHILDASFANSTYLWQNGSTQPTFLAKSGGTYWVRVDASGCSTTDTITLKEIPLPALELGNDTSFCTGSSLLLDASYPNGTYLWQDGSTQATQTVLVQGLYSVTVTVQGCSNKDSIFVRDVALPVVNIGRDTAICQGETLLLTVSGTFDGYLWQDGSTQSTFNVTDPGTYKVQVNQSGCLASDEIVIARKDVGCNCLVYVPNAFTPDKNGRNDIFKALGTQCNYSFFRLSVFNRWGELIFLTTKATEGWNGKLRGKEQPDGVYAYLLEYKLQPGSPLITKKGTVLLLR